ncbi:GDP/UDP-N,N'-diacetylbacillosamine 2-epimerase (hydrolyzing) [Candidatus Terasakiella magnetica]|nr:GDP/UDP-N,N'-diacetylbacillosamine 2-epimerase (hydrolyzing) [Candidatus Terasakiella magnetica]
MRERRRICVVTGTRAEYGHLKWLMHDLAEDLEVELQIIVTGTHLSPAHGMTVREIEADGLHPAARVDMLLVGDSQIAVAKSMGLGVIGFADAFERLAPQIVVVLGDRYEALAAVQAAMILRIPIAHIHGGEATEGAIDEAIRHSITKMAHLHFAAAEPYARRIVQLGEQPDRVFNFGAPGLDHIARTPFLNRKELERSLDLALGSPLLLLTYHPVTLMDEDQSLAVTELVRALDSQPQATVIVTGVNADSGNAAISRVFAAYAKANSARVRVVESLGYRRYLSLMRLADVVVGNSSSGILEAPALGVPTVNIGERQQGRLRAESILDCAAAAPAITAAIAQALSPVYRDKTRRVQSPYGQGEASRRIAQVLKTHPLDGILIKRFNDQ